ncbi:hypothetical protein ACFL6M_06580, partial [Candidatus Eisenbacteria bacterium]
DYVANLRLILVPIFNVDGHERESVYNRFTQVGPDSGFGTRRNALTLDLNRDFAKLETPECQALVRLASEFQPHIYVDLHTDDGMGHQYDILFSPAVNPTFPGERDALVRKRLAPYLVQSMEERGFLSRWIGWPANSLDLSKGIVGYGISTRLSTGYFETRQCISILSEAYPYKPYERRVRASDAFVRSILDFAATNRIDVCEAIDGARSKAIEWAQETGRHTIALGCRADRERGHEIAWQGKRFDVIMSEITGRRYPLYSEEDLTYNLPFFDKMLPRATAVMPHGYLMDAAFEHVAETLRRHAINVRRLSEPFECDVDIYRIKSASFQEQPYQGHHPLSDIEGAWSTEKRLFPAGTYWIPLAHPAGLTAMHLLEPESADALLVWNAFDTIFERGIILERWALEENARDLLEDETIRREYEEALADSAFAADPNARLEFFFQKTPYVEERERLYPVFRVLHGGPVKLAP